MILSFDNHDVNVRRNANISDMNHIYCSANSVIRGEMLNIRQLLSNQRIIRFFVIFFVCCVFAPQWDYAQDLTKFSSKTCNYVSDPSTATTSWQSVSGTLSSDYYNRYDFYLTQGRMYTFSLCSDDGGSSGFDSYMGLFGYGYGCYSTSLSCLAYNDDACGTASKFTYTATQDGWTSLYITGYSSSASGSYTLRYMYAASGPSNSTCANATTLDCGATLNGTTVGTSGAAHGLPSSASTSNYGVWYTFTGTGGQTTITVTPASGYDTKISVVSGSCGSFTWVGSADNGGSGSNDTYTFSTTSGTRYNVYVAHYSSTSTTTGTFTISRECPPPANATCATATTLDCGATLSGTTIGTTGVAHGLPSSASTSNYGVWYTFIGTGGQTTITVTPASGYDTEISVASGSCGSFTWVGSADNGGSGSNDTYTFTTTSGTRYYAYVAYYGTSGTSSNTGTFTISSSCAGPSNYTCANAITLDCGASLNGTTVGTPGTAHGLPSSADVSNYGVWYTFMGTGGETTLTSTTTFDHELVVVSGSCGNFTWVGSKDASTATETYTFPTTSGTRYYVYVAHYSSGNTTTGTFTISRTCVVPCTPRTLSFGSSPTSVAIGSTINCIATPSAGSGTITYSSSNTNVITVVNGVVTGVGVGSATITATISENGGNCEASATHTVNVVLPTLTITQQNTNPLPLCGTENVTLLATVSGFLPSSYAFYWYSNSACTAEITSGVSGPNNNTLSYPAADGAQVYCRLEKRVASTTSSIQTFNYTGGVQTYTVPAGATSLQLEVWGAQGGSYSSTYYGGYGGYSKGTLNSPTAGSTLYVVVGQQPTAYTTTPTTGGASIAGGYNGGGNSVVHYYSGGWSLPQGGGGATHIATVTGVLSSLSSQQDNVLIVAGGGSGSGYYLNNGTSTNGGFIGYAGGGSTSNGYSSGSHTYTANQTTAGYGASFGQGASVTNGTNYRYGPAGGGGGWYGGGNYNTYSDTYSAEVLLGHGGGSGVPVLAMVRQRLRLQFLQ